MHAAWEIKVEEQAGGVDIADMTSVKGSMYKTCTRSLRRRSEVSYS